MFDYWFTRLKNRLRTEEIDAVKPILNDVICGESRAMISGGDYKRAYNNLRYFYWGYPEPYYVKIWKMGRLPFYLFAVLWRFYQYLKINKGVLLQNIRVK